MRRSATHSAGAQWAAAALLLLLLLQGACAVQMYLGLDDLIDLQRVGIVDQQNTVQRHTLLSFSNNGCRVSASHEMGFPFNYTSLPGEVFELGQVGSGSAECSGVGVTLAEWMDG